MSFPHYRPRRMRRTPALRRMVRETVLTPDNFILPLFVIPGRGVRQPIDSMPGVERLSPDLIVDAARQAWEASVPAVLLFGVPDRKDEGATEAFREDGVVQEALGRLREALPDMVLVTDVCLCAYMSHGHCGIVHDGEILNDPSLDVLAQMALSHARAGATIVAPSDMMDGRVGAIREALDGEGFENVAIMSYAAKFSSAFYGPFREAADSAPAFGDRRSYQMDPANAREAVREVALDIQEDADIVMVKPALAYLDIIYRVKSLFDMPLAAYNVSGEFSMVKAAGKRGWLDERAVRMEILMAIKRAGADMILTYDAVEAAREVSG